jgi:hypothetical protein
MGNVPSIVKAATLTLPDGVYLADIRQGQRSLYADAGIVAGGDVLEPVQIVLGRNGGTVTGKLGVQTADATIVLVPDVTLRANTLAYRSTRPSTNGTFEFKNVAPGNYKLFAWEGVLATAWTNAEFLKRYEDVGLSLKVDDKEIKLEAAITPIAQTN